MPLSVELELREILQRWKKNEALTLGPATKLEDLNIDSLDLVEVMFEIEEKFDVSLMQSHQDARQASFADLVGWIEEQLALQRSTVAAKPAMQPVKSTSRIADDELDKITLPQ